MNTLFTILLSVVVSAQIDSTTLMIGDQTTLHLTATTNAGEQVGFPNLEQALGKDIAIVERGQTDTLQEKDGRITYKQDVVLTSFKDSLLYIEPIPFTVNGDTVRSNSISLNVIMPFDKAAMDSTMAITDIKPVLKPKIWWWGIIRWILLGLLIAGLGVGGYFLYQWLKKRKHEKVEDINPELLRPCEEVALEKLDKIKQEKIWQAGEHKRYFSELTFVIREYIGRRYAIRSTEKTSDETLAAIKPVLIAAEQKELYEKLRKMLQLADLVKFAKWQPTPDENEISLLSAYQFVRETTPAPQEETPSPAKEAAQPRSAEEASATQQDIPCADPTPSSNNNTKEIKE